MIGSGLKKLATKYGMKVSNGVAYGVVSEYATTFSEGKGYKMIIVASQFTNTDKKGELFNLLSEKALGSDYNLQNFNFYSNGIQFIFYDKPGTNGKIELFIQWLFPLLQEYTVTKATHCIECDGEITDEGTWKLIQGVAYHLHDNCGDKIRKDFDESYQRRMQEDSGSYLTGSLGAVIGALLGSVVWAIVLNVGYVASIIGYLIVWLAEKGYTLLKGKNGKGKIVILIVTSVLGVLVGTLGAELIELVKLIGDGELYDYTYSDIPYLIGELFNDSEYMGYIVKNIGLGLIFACLGWYSILKKAGNETSKTKVIDLK